MTADWWKVVRATTDKKQEIDEEALMKEKSALERELEKYREAWHNGRIYIPNRSQEDLTTQIGRMVDAARNLGLYDACDWVRANFKTEA